MVPLSTIWLLGCAPQEGTTKTDPTHTTPTETDTEAPLDTATTETTPTPTGDTASTVPAIDCSVLPEPTYLRFHDYVTSSEDFTFDDEGYLWGVSWSSRALIRTPLEGTAELMLPDVSTWGRGVRFLPGGDLVVAEPDHGVLLRVDRQTMGAVPVRGGLNSPNGIAIDDDGMVMLTQASGRVVRIDPDAGTEALVHDTPVSTDGITFAPDYERVYWNSEFGQLVTAVLDGAGDIVEQPSLFVELQTASILDGMAADACGNLYVVDMSGGIIRVHPDGTQENYLNLMRVQNDPAASFISAVNFGSGIGGWESDHLYVMSLDHGVFEIDVGIPGKWEPHLPQN